MVSCSLGQDIIGWRDSKFILQTLHEKVIVRQFAQPNYRILAGNDPALDRTNTENDSEMKNKVEGRQLHQMVKIHDFVEMWQGSQNLCPTPKKCRSQTKQITAVGYILDMKEIVKASWSLFQHHSAAAFKLS